MNLTAPLKDLGPDPPNMADLLYCAPTALDVLLAGLESAIESVQNPHLRALLTAIFNDPKVREPFSRLPAAMNRHHTFRHGLLQHTLEVADRERRRGRSEEVGIPRPDMPRSRGDWTLLHDVGKVEECEGDSPSTSRSRAAWWDMSC